MTSPLLRTRKRALGTMSNDAQRTQPLYLSTPRGTGKTVACCVALARCIASHDVEAVPTWVIDAAQPQVRTELRATRDEVLRAASFFEAALRACQTRDEVDARAAEVWQATKKKWLALSPGQSVPYPRIAVLCYPICTALLHSLFLARILHDQLPEWRKRRIVALCAGSGAEAVALAMTKDCQAHIDVVDILPAWNELTSHLVQSNHATHDSRPTGAYHTLDLLNKDASKALQDLIQGADLVTLMYGLTELVDHDRAAARRCIESIVSNLAPDSAFVIVDPKKTCFGKDAWLDGIPAVQSCRALVAEDVKYTMQREHVEQSVLAEWAQNFGLIYNDDIKLSMHVWLRIYQPKSMKITQSVRPTNVESSLALYITYTSAQQDNVVDWLQRINSRLRVFTLAVTDASVAPEDQDSAVWHLASALESQPEVWDGVAVLTLAQVKVVASANSLHGERLCRAFRDLSKCTVFDDAQWYLNFRKAADWTRALIALRRVVASRPAVCIVCCPEERFLARANEIFAPTSVTCVVDALGLEGSPCEDSIELESHLAKWVNSSFGCTLDLCHTKGDCKGFIDPLSAVTVFTAKPPRDAATKGRTLAFKSLQLDPAPFLPSTRDVILHLPRPVPGPRLADLCSLAAFRLASLSSTSSSSSSSSYSSSSSSSLSNDSVSNAVRVHVHLAQPHCQAAAAPATKKHKKA